MKKIRNMNPERMKEAKENFSKMWEKIEPFVKREEETILITSEWKSSS